MLQKNTEDKKTSRLCFFLSLFLSFFCVRFYKFLVFYSVKTLFFFCFCFFLMNQSPTVRPKCFVTHLIRVLSAQFEFPWPSPRGTVKAYVFWRLTNNLSTGKG